MSSPSPTRARSRLVVLLAAAALVVALLALFLRLRESGAPPPNASRERPTTTALERDPDLGRAPGAPERAGVASVATDVVVAGRVIDATFEVPVAALVADDRGTLSASDGETGRFRFAPGPAPRMLLARSTGYEDARVELADQASSSDVVLRLVPERRSSVIVEHEGGAPAANVPVNWRVASARPERWHPSSWIDSRAQTAGLVKATRTDGLGVASMRLGATAIAIVDDPRIGAHATVRVEPGDDVRIEIPSRTIAVQLVDANDHRPAAGRELDLWFPREADASSTALVTDRDGLVTIAPTSFPVLLRATGPATWRDELVPLDRCAGQTGFGGVKTMLRIDAFPASEPLVVELRQLGMSVHLVDAATGAAIDAPVRVALRQGCSELRAEQVGACTRYSPRFPLRSFDDLLRAENGVLVFPPFWNPREGSELTLWILAAGYRPLSMAPPSGFPRATPGVPTLELELEPVPTRTLHVRTRDGAPFTRGLLVHEPAADFVGCNDAGRPDGVYGPFDWLGGDLVVRPAGKPTIALAAADLAAHDVLELEVDVETGALVVEGVPESGASVPIVAKLGLDGELHWPSAVERGTRRFDALPTGSYLVGPPDWIRCVELNSFTFRLGVDEAPRAVRVDVAPGATTHMRWMSSWVGGREIEGRVEVKGPGRVDPFLVPLYGPPAGAVEDAPGEIPVLVCGRTTPRIPLDRDGRYRIHADEALPRLIAVCVADPVPWWGAVMGFRVVDTILPGESAEIATASIELAWAGAPAKEPVEVVCEMPVAAYRHPLQTMTRTLRTTWNTATALRIDGLPPELKRITAGERAASLELHAGEVARVTMTETSSPR